MMFLKISQVAERLQCSEHTVREMIRVGKLHGVRLGEGSGDWRVAEIALAEYGAGGARNIVLAVSTTPEMATTTATESTTTPTAQRASLAPSGTRLRGGKHHV